jgi:hypothetical protein
MAAIAAVTALAIEADTAIVAAQSPVIAVAMLAEPVPAMQVLVASAAA